MLKGGGCAARCYSCAQAAGTAAEELRRELQQLVMCTPFAELWEVGWEVGWSRGSGVSTVRQQLHVCVYVGKEAKLYYVGIEAKL